MRRMTATEVLSHYQAGQTPVIGENFSLEEIQRLVESILERLHALEIRQIQSHGE